ncbi:phage tail tube protein [Xanthobacter sp.]|uniref:phage tail tube protein n=1 Tax=Xanthobacter TaxID=279 RepID=UPI0025DFACEF|nr:phage tail tube protein [Xanthobacter sp.]
MALFSASGSKIFIGAVKVPGSADFVAADFTAEDWTEIDEVESVGSFGDTSELITSNVLSKGRTRKAKGVKNAGTMEVTMNADYGDEGQLALRAAAAARDSYAFKVEFPDKPAAGASPKNSVRFFTALVMSASDQMDEANAIIKLTSTLEINSNVVVVHASAT